MKNLIIKSIIFISCFSTFQTYATGTFWTEYYYHITVCNSAGQRITNQEITVSIDGKSYTTLTDSLGSVQIYMGGTENCPSGRNLIARLLRLEDWSWIPNTLTISYKGFTHPINKNWKRHFRKSHKKEEFYNYETGKISKQSRRKNKT